MIGGGPAGCAAATSLARTGRSVLLVVDQRRPRTFGVGEGAPPGLDRVVDDVFGPGTFVPADHLRSLGNRAAWGHADLWCTDHMFNPFGTGWHLDRAAFDARLLAAAGASGVTFGPVPVPTPASPRLSSSTRPGGAPTTPADTAPGGSPMTG